MEWLSQVPSSTPLPPGVTDADPSTIVEIINTLANVGALGLILAGAFFFWFLFVRKAPNGNGGYSLKTTAVHDESTAPSGVQSVTFWKQAISHEVQEQMTPLRKEVVDSTNRTIAKLDEILREIKRTNGGSSGS